MKIKVFLKKFMIWSLCIGLLVTSFGSLPANATTAPTADEGADLVALLRNPAKLQAQASKFSRAVDRLRPLANKSVFTASDLALVDSFINELDEGVEIVVHARSKAFAAARRVTAFEQGVKRAAQGKNPQQFINELEANPNSVMKIPGAREAAAAYQNATRAEANLLKQIGTKMKAQGTRPKSISSLPSSPQEANRSRVVRVSFSNRVAPSSDPVAEYGIATPTMFVDPFTAAAIALAVAYLGVQTYRLTSGAIGKCVKRAIKEYKSCIRDERRDGSGLSTSERLYCRGLYLLDVEICILLPI